MPAATAASPPAAGCGSNGRSSRAARPGAALRYAWRIVRRPRGSKASLRRRRSARPGLRTDVAGTYRVRLTVTETRRRPGGGRLSRSSSDVVTVSAAENLPPIGMPVETIRWNGGNTEETIDTGIRLGSKTYWLGMPQGNSVQAVILDRGTLEVLYSASYPGSQADAETLAAKVHSFGNKALVLISNPAVLPNSEVNPAFLKIVKGLGVSVSSLERVGRAGWSAIGIPESKGGGYLGSGLSFQNVGVADVRGNLDGYLQADSNDGFSFVPGARVAFDTSVPGQAEGRNAIQVGDQQYASAPLAGCGTGGFQVEVVLAETLVPAAGQTFTTNGCGTADDAAGQQKLANFLAAVNLAGGSSEGAKLVLVQSIGEPRDASAGNWVAIAQQLGRLGGTEAVFAEHGGSYALVGTLGVSNPPLEESSSALTGKPARISGVLKPDRLNLFVPVLASPTGSTPFELSTVAYQAPQAWPHSQTAGEKAALAYIAEDVLELDKPTAGSSCYVSAPDVRSEYCNLDYRSQWSAWAGKLDRHGYRAGHGFSEEDWKNVVEELAPAEGFGEFEAVQTVWSLVTTLQGAIGATAVNGEVNLKKIALEVEESLKPPAKSEATGWWLEFLANIASIASYYDFGLEDEVVQKTTGAISGALFIAAQWQAGPEGSPLFERWRLSADEVAVQMAKNYRAASNGIGRVGELIVSDYGKLKAVAQDPNLALNAKAVAATAEPLESGAKQWSYGALLPVAYEAVSLQKGEQQNNPLPKNAAEYTCESYEAGTQSSSIYNPFHSASAAAQYRTELPSPTLGVLVINGSQLPIQGDPEENPRSPTAKLMEPLFAAPEKGGLGLYVPWFWRTAFGYGSSQTKSVLCR